MHEKRWRRVDADGPVHNTFIMSSPRNWNPVQWRCMTRRGSLVEEFRSLLLDEKSHALTHTRTCNFFGSLDAMPSQISGEISRCWFFYFSVYKYTIIIKQIVLLSHAQLLRPSVIIFFLFFLIIYCYLFFSCIIDKIILPS